VLWLTVWLFNQYAQALSAYAPALRYLLVGGDVLDPQVIAQLLRSGAPANLLNGYGPTETTTFASTYRILGPAAEGRSIPIGRPIGNTQIYLLDGHAEPVPVGVEGEICIGGAGVAHGYLRRPGLTAERFVADPFGAEPGARMYRTGDVGRWRADGNVEFVGRTDHQVKIRGYRIELGEIESQLQGCAGVRDAVVLAREGSGADAPGEKRLVAYYTCEKSSSVEPEAGSLRAHLQQHLPSYMVPAAYVRLEEFPLTAHGKLDRRALPAPEGSAYARGEYVAPQGEIEIALAQIWQQLLRVERVGREDNFFELGGHSLLAVQLVSRILQHQLHCQQ
jgi:acyl-CoA synthetase (AMP-forming)/AMP-acid ligase II